MIRFRRLLAGALLSSVIVAPLATPFNIRTAAALSPSIGYLDAIVAVDSSGDGAILIGGWALTSDYPTVSLGVRILVDGQVWPMPLPGYIIANSYRSDVGAAYPGYGNYHGFYAWVPAPHGSHTVCAQAQNSGVYSTLGACQSYSMPGLSPVKGTLWTLVPNASTQQLTIGGFAVTADFPTVAIGVRTVIDGFAGAMFYSSLYDANVAAAYNGYGPYHAFSRLIAAPQGNHTVCMQGQNSGVYNNFGACTNYYMAPNRTNQLADTNSIVFYTSYGTWKTYACTTSASVCDNSYSNNAPGRVYWPYENWTNDFCSGVGSGPYDFSIPCTRHDFSWRNLQRITADFPTSPSINTGRNQYAANGRFRDDMKSRCNEWSLIYRAQCYLTAGDYTAGVNAVTFAQTGVVLTGPYPASFV